MYFIVIAWESKIASSLVSCLFLSTTPASHNQCYEFLACLCSMMLFIQYWLYTFHLHAHKHVHALLQAYFQKSTVWTLHTENTVQGFCSSLWTSWSKLISMQNQVPEKDTETSRGWCPPAGREKLQLYSSTSLSCVLPRNHWLLHLR